MIGTAQQRIFEVKNDRGQLIHCVHDWVSDTDPLVVVPPLYEGTVRTNLLPMLYLVSNGFSVLRFDFTNHRGNSEGEMRDFTLSSACDDLGAVLQHTRDSGWFGNAAGLALYATSISSRVAVRYLAENHGVVQIHLSILGVIDMVKTLTAITKVSVRELIRKQQDQPETCIGLKRIIHYQIDADHFLPDLIQNNWADASGTRVDVDRIETPTYLIVAENDKWIDIDDYKYVYGDNPDILRGTYKLPNAGHEIYKNPEAAKVAGAQATRLLRRLYYGVNESEILCEPTLTEMIDQNTRERTREASRV
jgi:pimeloyl-ACP methyl ester carboxylesterase